LLGAWRYYELPQLPSGLTPNLYLTREIVRPLDTAPRLASEIKIVEIAGEQMVQIGNGDPNPAGDPGELAFHIPTGDGMITISATGIRHDELGSVIESLRRESTGIPNE
jgi:hypothetical protein